MAVIIDFLKTIEIDELNRVLEDIEDRSLFDFVVCLKLLKETWDQQAKSYIEVLEKDFKLRLYYSALLTWFKDNQVSL